MTNTLTSDPYCKLTPFQIITDKFRNDYCFAVAHELMVAIVHAKDGGNETKSFRVPKRGDLDVSVAEILRECCVDTAILVEDAMFHTTFIVNVNEAHDFVYNMHRDHPNATMKEDDVR